MAYQGQNVEAYLTTPDMSVRTPGGIIIETYDVRTSMVLIVSFTVIAIGILLFLHDSPILIELLGKCLDEMHESATIEVDCKSKTFKKDPQKEKVKLKVCLQKETLNADIIEASEETQTEKHTRTKKYTLVIPNPEAVFHGERQAGKEGDLEAEVKENPEGADNLNKENIQSPSQNCKEASGSTKVKQEEKSCSAAKKSKVDPIGEPGTSGVSNTRKTRKFKEGVVTDDDLQTLGKTIAGKWDRLARRLPGVTEDDIEGIEDRYKNLPQRGFHMLKLWKGNNGKDADYKTLYDALVHELVQRKDLAEKYCLE